MRKERSRHVLHVITRLDCGGSAENTLLTAIGLVEKGYTVSILCGVSDNPPSVKEQSAVSAGIRIWRSKSLVRNISPFRDVAALLQLCIHLKTHRYDIIHTHTSKAGVLGRMAAWLVGAGPVVHTPHGHIFYGYFSRLVTAVFVYVEKLLMWRTDVQITLTQHEKDDYLAHGIGPAGKMVPIFSGIELESFLAADTIRKRMRETLGFDDTQVVVGTVARLVAIKNHDLIVRAAEQLCDRAPRLRFVFVGDGELRETLERRIDEAGLSSRFLLTGWQNNIAELLAAFDIFIMCSRNEGQGRAFVEAQASAVPVIGTRVGGVAEVLDEGRTGLLIDDNDAAGLASAIEQLYTDENRRAFMANNCRPWAIAHFSAQAMVDKIEKLYRQLLEQKV